MIYSIKNKTDKKYSEDLADLHSKVQQLRLVQKLCKQCFHYDTRKLFEPITKAVTHTMQEVT